MPTVGAGLLMARASSGNALRAAYAEIGPSEAPLGTFAPTPVQRAVIETARRVSFGNGFVRNLATRAALKARAAPIDYDYHGLNLRLYPGRYASARHMLMTPRWSEARERAFLLDHLPPAGTFLDIGCNCGFYLFFAAAHRPGARIVGFEPVPRHHAGIGYNIRANGLANASVLNLALSDRDGEATFHEEAESLVTGSGKGFTVRTRPLLDVARDLGLARIDCLKIDVEGAEDLVLLPFLETAEPALWPRAILIEDNAALWRRDCLGALRDRGYREAWRTRLNLGLVRDAAPTDPRN